MSRPISWPNKIQRITPPTSFLVPNKGRLASLEQFKAVLLDLPLTGDCCVFSGATVNGYPVISVEGKQEYLHLHWWKLFHQRLPTGRLRQLCPSQGCVSPLHWVESQNLQNFAKEVLGTPLISPSEKAHNSALLSSPNFTPFPDPAQINSPVNQNTGENANISLDIPDCHKKDQTSTTAAYDNVLINQFDTIQMREDLIYLFGIDGVPKTWQMLRDLVPIWQCPDDMLIELIKNEPRVCHLRPDVHGTDGLTTSII